MFQRDRLTACIHTLSLLLSYCERSWSSFNYNTPLASARPVDGLHSPGEVRAEESNLSTKAALHSETRTNLNTVRKQRKLRKLYKKCKLKLEQQCNALKRLRAENVYQNKRNRLSVWISPPTSDSIAVLSPTDISCQGSMRIAFSASCIWSLLATDARTAAG
jgi:hypothetical protein